MTKDIPEAQKLNYEDYQQYLMYSHAFIYHSLDDQTADMIKGVVVNAAFIGLRFVPVVGPILGVGFGIMEMKEAIQGVDGSGRELDIFERIFKGALAVATISFDGWKLVKDIGGLNAFKGVSGVEKTSGADFSKPKHYLDDALKQQGLDKVPEKLKQKWIHGDYNYEVRVHPGDPKYTDAKIIYRVSRKAKPVPGKQGSGMEYMDKNGKWWHQSELREFNGDGTLNPLFNHDAAKNTHIPTD